MANLQECKTVTMQTTERLVADVNQLIALDPQSIEELDIFFTEFARIMHEMGGLVEK